MADFDKQICFKHIGSYACRAGFIKQHLIANSSHYEQGEKLEQLTVLNQGFDIFVEKACEATGFGVDTQADLKKVKELLQWL